MIGRIAQRVVWRNVIVGLACGLLASAPSFGADVTWVGPAVGNWDVGTNWSGGAVPAQDDNVTILEATVFVRDIRQIDGAFTVGQNGVIGVMGTDASLTVTGPTALDDGRMSATDGGVLDLSQAQSLLWSRCQSNSLIHVVGAGSFLDLSGVTTMTIDVPQCNAITTQMLVSGGGMVDLSGLETFSAPNVQGFNITLQLGGAIDFSSLVTMEGTFLLVNGDTEVALPSLIALSDSSWTLVNGGHITANALETAEACIFSPSGNEPIELASLTSITASTLLLNGTPSWTMPELRTLSDSDVLISDLSILKAPLLESIDAPDEGAAATVSVSGVSGFIAPMVTSVTNVAFVASEGAVLSLPALERYTATQCDQGIPMMVASDDGSEIRFEALDVITIDTPGCGLIAFSVTARDGASVDLGGLTTIETPGMPTVNFFSSDPGTVIDVSALRTFNGLRVLFFETNGGEILRAPGGGPTPPGCASGPGAAPAEFSGALLTLLVMAAALSCAHRRRVRPRISEGRS